MTSCGHYYHTTCLLAFEAIGTGPRISHDFTDLANRTYTHIQYSIYIYRQCIHINEAHFI